jgi:uncharacterized phage protein gp47/JayE
MTTYGLTIAGFVIKTFDTIKTELEQAYQGAFGSNIPLDGDSVFGQLIGIHAEREADLWEIAQDVYLSAYPDTAQGVALANAGALTGHTPIAATYSTVPLTLTATPGTTIPSGSQVGIPNTQTVFITTTDATIPAGGSASVTAQAASPGAVSAPAGTLTSILTPVAGWTAVTNALDATVGKNQETDAQFRARRAASLVVAEGGTVSATVNHITKSVPGVTFAGGIENRTDATDGTTGLPPHSIQVTVIGGADQDVADAIWASKPGGTNTYGTTSGTVTDSFGHAQTVYWNRGVNVPMYLSVTLTRGAGYPADGDTQVANALVSYVNGLPTGASSGVVANWLLASSLAAIPGNTGVTILQDRNPAPSSSANTAIAGNEKPTLTAANIAIS